MKLVNTDELSKRKTSRVVRRLPTEKPTWLLDLQFRGQSRLIACAILETDRGLVLIDPGPSSTLHTLESALQPIGGLSAVQDVVLTHIHLDHAGCVGWLAARVPEVTIHVHPTGAHHLVRPDRLIQSARRIYAERMDQLWGVILPVPEPQVNIVEDDMRLNLDGRILQAHYTPGHASHHIAWLEEQSGLAFVGDAAGLRIEGANHIIPVAPPPDIDVLLWEKSLSRLERQNPNQLFLTHFGVIDDASAHLMEMRTRLHAWADTVRCSMEGSTESDFELAESFHRSEMKKMRSLVESPFQGPYNYMGQPRESWIGLARYWRKKKGRAS